MRVVVAEKPSVARDLGRVLGATRQRSGYIEGNGLAITWCFGHMAELEMPGHYRPEWKRWSLGELPMIPDQFDLRLRKGVSDQFAAIEGLLSSADEVVNACDAGREGELIFRWVMELAGCNKPSMRLWVSSLTDQAIKAGWANLRPSVSYDRLGDAARCRSEADWLVGLNATRALTCRARDAGGGQLLSVGRVQTPTLAMIVGRDREIASFVPEPFWQIKATFSAEVPSGPDSFRAVWFRAGAKSNDKSAGGKQVSKAERVGDAATAEAIMVATQGQVGRVAKASRRRTTERPPLLYDLTSLQRRANQRFGLSAQETLRLAQALYEKHKLLTYPRTDARYLTPDQVPLLPDVVRGLQAVRPYAKYAAAILAGPIQPGGRVVNAAEVGDHHAILPTGRDPSSARLSPDEKRVFDLVARRLLAALSPDALFDVTQLVVEVAPGGPLPASVTAPLLYRAKGRVCRQEGWRAVDPPKKSPQIELPVVDVGDPTKVAKVEAKAGETRPPRPHNDASLLQGMETAGRKLEDKELMRAMRGCGLGTPATRAAILQVLIDREYVKRDKRDLRSTERGQALIDSVPVASLKSPELTGLWEGRLTEVAEGKQTRRVFMEAVQSWTRELVGALGVAELPAAASAPPTDSKELGLCPRCGKPVRERGPVFACDTGRACPFVVFKTMAKRKISVRMVRQLLKEGRSGLVKGFKSKAGKSFDAGLQWDQQANKVRFWFADRVPAAKPQVRVGDLCPTCGQGRIIQGRRALGCDRWREGCGFHT